LKASDASWESRLYESYVSSGHAAASVKDSPEEMFCSRKAFLTHITSHHLSPDLDAQVVDLGCGHGAFLDFLIRAGDRNVSGIDIPPSKSNSRTNLELLRRAWGI